MDIDDCLFLYRSRVKEIDFNNLKQRFRETASFDVSEIKVNKNFDRFASLLKKEGLYNGK